MYKFKQPLKKNPRVFFAEVKKFIFIWHYQKILISENNLERTQRTNISGFQNLLEYKVIYKNNNQPLSKWFIGRYVDQWNKIENPEISPCIYGQMNFASGTKFI